MVKRSKKNPDPNVKKRRKVGKIELGADELDWKPVSLPEAFEDVEGFYGLEEIDDVEIVKPEGQGQLKFKVTCIGYMYGLF